jgi:hypothetical protein
VSVDVDDAVLFEQRGGHGQSLHCFGFAQRIV